MLATEEAVSESGPRIVKCTFTGPCENREKATELISILRSIQKPSAAYRRDAAEYRRNVIEHCIAQAEKALELLGEPLKEAL